MAQHSFLSSVFFISIACFIFLSAEYLDETACKDDPKVNCTAIKTLCGNETFIPFLRDSCPETCNLCPTTAAPTPCEDDKNTDCSSYKDLCSNSKYEPLLKVACPVTCNLCPGATTLHPPTQNPRCYDSSSQCKEWAANGYCHQCFYPCSERTKYCAKTCGFCSPGVCKDCNF